MRNIILTLLLLLLSPSVAFAKGGVVTAADPRAAEAGREILRAGGSASDAAMAMMLVLTVVEPQSSGIGGGGFLLYHDGKSNRLSTIDGREVAPSSANSAMFLGPDGKPLSFMQAVPGGRSVGIPGNIALMARAHARWGKAKWARIFEPAIRLADAGYVVSPILEKRLASVEKLWPDFPAAQAIYWQDGRPKKAGDMVHNPALAGLLRAIARKGPKAFYSGQNAQAMIDATGKSVRNPTVMTKGDIAAYAPKDRAPVCVMYRVYKVCGMGPPSSGATTVFQILGLLERFDLKAMGKDNPQAWHLIAEAMLLAYADREKYLADPGFVKVPVAGLLDRGYVASRSALISLDTSLPSYAAGTPPGAEPRTAALSGEVTGTTHFVAVDGSGNIASMTSTIEGPFGSQLVANGYFLNNELTDFTFAPEKDGAPVANRVEAGKRPLSSMSPTIVYDASGKPIFAVGAAGGKRIIMQVAKILIAHLDWGLPVDQAIAAPNIYFAGEAISIEAGSVIGAKSAEMSKYGRMVLVTDLMPAKANAAEWTPNGWRGAADPRSEGAALEE
jgi:gamma-glutamyltranspeptidase / glutathione hydrolase